MTNNRQHKVEVLMALARRGATDGERTAAQLALAKEIVRPMEKEDAMAIAGTCWWEALEDRQAALAALQQPLLCLDFSTMHRLVESAVGGPVWTQEFINVAGLIARIRDGRTGGRDPFLTLQEAFAIVDAKEPTEVRHD